jgi:DNA N-6-adenine-methyltransferase (Dam).
MLSPALLSSNMEHWLTPPPRNDGLYGGAFMAAVLLVLGHIDMDPSANRGSLVPANTHIYGDESDGLAVPWIGSVYCNPPYGNVIDRWTRAMRQRAGKLRSCRLIGLLPARVDTSWCQRDVFASADAWCFWAGRLTFWRAWDPDDLAKRIRRSVGHLPDPFRQLDNGLIVGPDLDKKGEPSPAPFPSLVPYWGDDPIAFARVFQRHGVVTIRTGPKKGTYRHRPARAA